MLVSLFSKRLKSWRGKEVSENAEGREHGGAGEHDSQKQRKRGVRETVTEIMDGDREKRKKDSKKTERERERDKGFICNIMGTATDNTINYTLQRYKTGTCFTFNFSIVQKLSVWHRDEITQFSTSL